MIERLELQRKHKRRKDNYCPIKVLCIVIIIIVAIIFSIITIIIMIIMALGCILVYSITRLYVTH